MKSTELLLEKNLLSSISAYKSLCLQFLFLKGHVVIEIASVQKLSAEGLGTTLK